MIYHVENKFVCECGQEDVKENDFVCPHCGWHQ
jgi:Zn finger protein HypA/HybF involved in hydrogenase expression